MSKIFIVHPYDKSTLFLNEIKKRIRDSYPDKIEVIDIEPNQVNHEMAFKKLSSIQDGSTLVFLGHGSSQCVFSATDESFNAFPFINLDNIGAFQKINFFCFSCRSADFLKKSFSNSNLQYSLGFDDIPSDWNEVLDARSQDSSAYTGFTESTIPFFNHLLVDIISNTINSYIYHDLDFYGVYHYLILHINIAIRQQLIDRERTDRIAVANQLQDLRNNIKFFKRFV